MNRYLDETYTEHIRNLLREGELEIEDIALKDTEHRRGAIELLRARCKNPQYNTEVQLAHNVAMKRKLNVARILLSLNTILKEPNMHDPLMQCLREHQAYQEVFGAPLQTLQNIIDNIDGGGQVRMELFKEHLYSCPGDEVQFFLSLTEEIRGNTTN